MNKEKAFEWISKNESLLVELSNRIWELAETAFNEKESSRILVNVLKQHEFQVEESYANIPTAFRAVYGTGKYTIGILAEYDALPGLSQRMTTYPDPLEVNGPDIVVGII